MTFEELDDFLDDATHVIADLYEKRGGLPLTTNELYFLNDALTDFFYKAYDAEAN